MLLRRICHFALLIFILTGFYNTAKAQQNEVLAAPELVEDIDVSLLPNSDGNATVSILFDGDDADGWNSRIKQAQQLAERGYRIILRFPGPSQGFTDYESFKRLAQSIPKVVLALKQSVDVCIAGDPERPVPREHFANSSEMSFAIKSISIACRESNPEAHVSLGFVDAETLPRLLSLAEENSLMAYIDGYLTLPSNTLDFQRQILERHPAAIVRTKELVATGGPAFVTTAFRAFQERRHSVIIPTDLEGLHVADQLRKVFSATVSPTTTAEKSPEFFSETGEKQNAFLFSSFSDFERRMEYLAVLPPTTLKGFLLIPSNDVSDPVLFDAVTGKEYPLSVTGKDGLSYVGLPGIKWPMLIYYKRFSREHLETNEVTGAFDVPLEIIMARVQAVESRQNEVLKHYLAEARIEYHFRLPGGFTIIDVAFDNDFFYEEGVGQEWRQNKMYVNGVPWKGKTIPQLPIPEPEKVVSLPLKLTLGADYHYKLKGSGEIRGRAAWRIEFEPTVEDKPLYRGEVWIDKQTFERLRISATQTKLESPITSNDETVDFLETVQGDQKFNLIFAVEGQQIFSAGGRQVFSERKITFSNFRINTDGFEELRNSAYESNDVMLRETEKGLRYLKKDEQGQRFVEMEPSTRRKFWVFGAFYDRSVEFPLPFGGVNILNYNYRDNGSQLNLLIAGALNVVSLSDPAFLSENTDARVEAAIFTVPLVDPYYNDGVSDPTQDVRLFREAGNAGIGLRLGEYGKITAGVQFGGMFFLHTDDTSSDFRLPSNHFEIGPSLELNYTRNGVAISSLFSTHHRSNWRAWGMPDSIDRTDPKESYQLFQAAIGKTFYPVSLHKLGFSLNYLTGNDLDRFSAYQFFYLSDVSLAGYSGSGIRFDRGALAKSFYQFDFLGLIRLGARVEYARARNLEASRWDNHLGIGADGTVFGPWESLISYDVGFALKSDVSAVEHKFTVSFMLLKLF